MKRSSNRSVVTRLRALLLTAGLVLAGVVGVASPASADTGICSGYFGCVNSGHGDHGYGANSANSYWTMYPGHNCTNYAAFMAIKNGASSPPVNLGNADTWDTRAASYGVPVNGTPAVGAIAQWDAMHVAYVESVNSDGSITVSEDGYLGDYHWRIITHSGDWPDHFIHFADVSTAGGEMLWKLRNSNSEGPATAAFYYGPDTAKPVTGDWDGNGSVTIGVARNNGAGEIAWQLRNANNSGSPSATHTYGAPTDTPVVGNWDGVGTTTIGIVRNDGSGQLMWKLSNDNGTPYASFYYGASTDIPVVGDWDGNGSVTIGIARRDATSDQLIWKLRNSNSAGVADLSFYYGASTAIPVTGDWNADGVTTIGTARKDDGSGELLWQLRNSNDAGTPSYAFHYGGSFDTPIVGDWDNSGTTTIGIARG